MTKPEFFAYHQEFCKRMLELSSKKNADYTGASEDPFSNFSRVEALGVCTTEQGFLTRMTDKLCRLTNFVNGETLQVQSESVFDTLLDLANYTVLLSAYINDVYEFEQSISTTAAETRAP